MPEVREEVSVRWAEEPRSPYHGREESYRWIRDAQWLLECRLTSLIILKSDFHKIQCNTRWGGQATWASSSLRRRVEHEGTGPQSVRSISGLPKRLLSTLSIKCVIESVPMRCSSAPGRIAGRRSITGKSRRPLSFTVPSDARKFGCTSSDTVLCYLNKC